jgi:hypothetical protein
MMNNIIEATIFNVKFKGDDVLLPRIPMIPTDMPFEFKRLQFPVRLAFAMTITKVQGHRYKCIDYNWKIHTSYMDTRWKTFRFIRVHTRRKNLLYSIVYSKALQ